jgi:hypothetical protein
MRNQWHFPLINPKKKFPLKHYLDHILEEIKEFEEDQTLEEKQKEAVDILHSAETFIRKYFKNKKDFQRVKNAVVRKNRERGYYKL